MKLGSNLNAPQATPVSGGEGILPAARTLFAALADQEVRCGVYKNIDRIAQALAGESDFDLLVDNCDCDTFRQIAAALGAVRGWAHPLHDNALIGREDWFIPDKNGRYLHIDLADSVYVGPRFYKRYPALSFDQVQEWTQIVVDDVSVAAVSPDDGIRIEVLRGLFGEQAKHSKDRVELPQPGRFSGQFKDIQLRLQLAGSDVPIVIQIEDSSDVVSVDRGAARAFRKAIQGLSNYPGQIIIDKSRHWLRKLGFRVAVAVTRWNPGLNAQKRRLKPAGKIIAIVGTDGSGKSTQTQILASSLQRKFRAKVLYLGSNDGGWTKWRRSLRKIRKRNQEHDRGPKKKAAKKPKPQIAKSVWRFVIALIRWSSVSVAGRLRQKGAIVICDRWPQKLEAGFLDGPSAIPSDAGFLVKALNRAEWKLHARMAEHRPDAIIHLTSDFETSSLRKPGDLTQVEFDKRDALMARLREADPTIATVDARLELDEVTQQLSQVVWECLAKSDQVQDDSKRA